MGKADSTSSGESDILEDEGDGLGKEPVVLFVVQGRWISSKMSNFDWSPPLEQAPRIYSYRIESHRIRGHCDIRHQIHF